MVDWGMFYFLFFHYFPFILKFDMLKLLKIRWNRILTQTDFFHKHFIRFVRETLGIIV